MAIDLLNIQPHQVSRNLRGYSVFFYGEPKSGKTTIATKFPKHLLLAFEKGYNAIPGAMAQPINSWSEFRKTLKQLKDPAVKEVYETIIIDTADIAYDYCEKYICSNATPPVDTIGQIPFGQGYTMVAKEFDECLRSIVQMDYGLVLISHSVDKTFKDEQGVEYNQIVPTLGSKPRNIVSRMCDIIGYSRPVQLEDGSTATKLFMRGTHRYVAGSRFKYTPDVIDFTYKDLVNAICTAIDKQMAEDGAEFFTEERNNAYKDTVIELDFDTLMAEFGSLISSIPGSNSKPEDISEDAVKFKEFWAPRITQITDKYLGKGKKVGQCSRDQVEALDLIVTDLRELIESTR